VPEVPRLLDCSESSLTIPYYEHTLDYQRSSGKLLPLPVAKQAIAALRNVYEAGYAVIDASIDNVLVDRREGLKLIDLEFAHRYEQRPPSFEQSYDIAGPPPDFAGDQPIQGGNCYDRNWRPYIGLSLRSLLADPLWLQRLKRGLYVVAHAHRFAPRLARYYFRATLGRARHARSAGNFARSLPLNVPVDAACEPTPERRAA
jgi:hypothetical protein